jgi:hypothetical protein
MSFARQKRIAVNHEPVTQRLLTSRDIFDLRLRKMQQFQAETKGRDQTHHQTASAKTNICIKEQVNSRRFRTPLKCITMNEWLDEWRTAPDDPLPSSIRALSLINEPAGLDLDSHEQQAQNVMLGHYYPEMIPEGRAQQSFELEQKRREANGHRGQEALDAVQQVRRMKERQGVIKAAQSTWTIDLTEDDTVQRDVLQPIPDNPATRPHYTLIPPFYPAQRSPSCSRRENDPSGAFSHRGPPEFPQVVSQQCAPVRGVQASHDPYSLFDDRYTYDCYGNARP